MSARKEIGLPCPKLVAEVVALGPRVAELLFEEHVADDHGCCKSCSTPQGGVQAWPCTLRAVATAALTRHKVGVSDRT